GGATLLGFLRPALDFLLLGAEPRQTLLGYSPLVVTQLLCLGPQVAELDVLRADGETRQQRHCYQRGGNDTRARCASLDHDLPPWGAGTGTTIKSGAFCSFAMPS